MNGYEIKVINIFNTSIGVVAILEFPNGETPFIGQKLHRSLNEMWEVQQIGFHSGKAISELHETYVGNHNLWSCNLKESTENVELNRNDIIFYKQWE
jgi:hypothetical protein